MAGVSGNGKGVDYKYNNSDIRTEKTVNGVKTKYHLTGDKVTYEENGYNTYKYNYSQNVTWTYHGFDIPVNTGVSYTYSFDAYISSDTNIPSTGTTFIANGENGFGGSFNYDNTKKGQWQHFEVTKVATTGTARILLYPTTSQIPATTGYIKYKNVQFKQVGTGKNLFGQPLTDSGFSVRGNGTFEYNYDSDKSNSIYYTYDSNGNLVSMNLSEVDIYSNDLYETAGNHTPVQLSGTNSAAEKFNATKSFDSVSVNCPSWSNNVGNLTLSLYKWNTDYNTTISGVPVASKQFVNFTDNQWLEISFAPQTAGDYLWVLNNPNETVGVWKYDGSNNSSTAYLNGSIVSGDYMSKISYKADDDLYETAGNHTPVQLSGTNSAAEKFKSTKLFNRVSVNCPSWSNNIGNLTLSLYKWNTDYNTTISAAPIVSKQFVNFTDNQWLEISFAPQTAGDYLWVLNNPSETVGVYKYDGSNNSSTAYLNGSIVSGDYMSKISYKANEYYYIRNAQGDIIRLIDENGAQVVSYTYDTWGKLISIDGSLKDSVGIKNPYRYRGYRYDTETGLYYLQSRYYNPEWGRFINADEITGKSGELLTHNMFSYCKNNPVNMQDDDGHFAWLIGAAIGVATQYAADIIDNAIEDRGFSRKAFRRRSSWGDYANSAIGGALGGGFIKNAIKIVGGAALKTGINYASGQQVSRRGFVEDIGYNLVGDRLGKYASKKLQPRNLSGFYFKNYNKLIGKGKRRVKTAWKKYSNRYSLIRDNAVGTAWNSYTSRYESR